MPKAEDKRIVDLNCTDNVLGVRLTKSIIN